MNNDDQLYGLFGGTFDPIHYGHITPIKAVLQSAGLANVTYIPAAQPAHRASPEASADARVAMTRIALDDETDLDVDAIELDRAAPSYTIDTLQSLREQNPERRYALIVGMDALLGLETWHRWQTLQQSVHIIALMRHGFDLPHSLPRWWRDARVDACAELQQSPAGKIICIETPLIPISATSIRARIAAGEDVREWMPPGVCEYIDAHDLYQKPSVT